VTRRRVVIGTIVAVLACVVWAPALIAEHYADGPGGAEVGIARLDRGWEFVYHAVRLSRGARLGSEDAALTRAREIWASRPGAESVDLVYMDGPFRVPVPADGWVVRGRVCGGPSQPIGVLDYPTGRVAWTIRPVTCP
jgi:hypothetical protein